MSYVDKILVAGEAVCHRARFHWLEKLFAVLLCPLLVGLFWLLALWGTEMVVTTRRVVLKRGVLARRTEELSLDRIEEVRLSQSILGRLLGYGRLYVRGMGGGDISFPTMAHPLSFKQTLDAAKAQAAPARSA